jgi:hypothetical protein
MHAIVASGVEGAAGNMPHPPDCLQDERVGGISLMQRITSAEQREAFRKAVETKVLCERGTYYIPATVRYELPPAGGASAPALSEAIPVRHWRPSNCAA